jgi:hypothetical protein
VTDADLFNQFPAAPKLGEGGIDVANFLAHTRGMLKLGLKSTHKTALWKTKKAERTGWLTPKA